MKRQIFGLVILLLTSPACLSQRVEWKAWRITEENDFFNLSQRGIDRYYTQGARLEFLYGTQSRKFSERLLIPASRQSKNIYSIGLTQQIYTPKRTYDYDFVGDMPYSGTLYFSNKLDSYDSSKHLRLVSTLDAGIIGPIALAKQIQGVFHKIIGNNPAAGWDVQLRNDLVLNYSLRAEKRIVKTGLFSLEAKAGMNVGTLLVSATGGFNFRFGNWNAAKRFVWEAFFLPEVRAIGYNSLLQGGIFNRMNANYSYSQYFLEDIYPIVYSHGIGFQMRYKRLELLYKQVNLTREFSGQLPHYYGSVTFTCWFRKKSPPRW